MILTVAIIAILFVTTIYCYKKYLVTKKELDLFKTKYDHLKIDLDEHHRRIKDTLNKNIILESLLKQEKKKV